MIADLKPYRVMKDSGVPWLGKVPSTWNIARNGGLFVQRNETRFAHLPILEVSLKTGVQVRNFDESGRKQVMSDRDKYKRARKGDLAYNMMRMWQGAIGMAPTDGLVSPAYVVARPLRGIEPRFYLNLFRIDAYMGEIDKFSHGIVKDRNRLYWEDFKQMPSLVPPLDEQAAIVRFLDHADRRIRRYIRAKQKLIKLLEEQKQAIIHRAITRGLDPNVRLKPSGIEWLGDVPEHWEVGRLSQFFTLQRGFDITKEQQRTGSIPVVSSGGISSYHDCATGKGPGVLVGRKGTAGSVHYVDSDYWAHDTTLWVNDFKGNDPRFVYYVLTVQDLKRFDTGSANPTLNRNRIHPERVAFPSPNEQTRIATQVDKELSQVDVVTCSTQRAIGLLREYRTRLIADVVTGKLDVREAAAKLPDESGKSESLDEAENPIEDAEETEVSDLDAVLEEDEA